MKAQGRYESPIGHIESTHSDRKRVCCWAKDDHLDVEFVTTSSRTCRNLSSDQSLLQVYL